MSEFSATDNIAEEFKKKWKDEQEELKKQLILKDDFRWKIVPTATLPNKEFKKSSSKKLSNTSIQCNNTDNDDCSQIITTTAKSSEVPVQCQNNDGKEQMDLKYIGGVDISFSTEVPNDAVASLVVLRYPDFKVVYESYERVTMKKPYIPGFLGFREVEFLIELVDRLRSDKKNSMFFPQVIMVDGNGILHPSGFGLASHLGVLTQVPTIGVAKNLLYMDGLTRELIKKWSNEHLKKGGDAYFLKGDSGKIHGAILRSTDQCKQPVYISAGHRISLETSLDLVRSSCIYRIPEPVRQADLLSRQYIRVNTPDHSSN